MHCAMWVEIASVASLPRNDKLLDSHFHGNDRRDKKREEMWDVRDGCLFHRYIINVMVEL